MPPLSGSNRFQLGEGPSRGLLRDYESSDGPSFQALVNITEDMTQLSLQNVQMSTPVFHKCNPCGYYYDAVIDMDQFDQDSR